MKIKTKPAILLITLAITLTASLVISTITSKNAIENQVGQHLLTTVQSRANHVETLLKNNEETVQLLAIGIPFTNVLDQEIDYSRRMTECDLRIKRTIETNPDISRIRISNEKGIVVASSHEDVGFDLSQEATFIKGQEDVYIGEIHKSEFTGNYVLSISAPILVRDKFAGVLVINFDVENSLFKIITNSTGLGETGEIYLVDKNGYLISPSKHGEDAILKTKVNTEQVNLCFSEHLGNGLPENIEKPPFEYPSYSSEIVLGTHRYIPVMQWCMIAESAVEEVFRPVREQTVLLATIFSVLFFVLLIIAVIVSRSIILPITKLHQGTEEIIKGNLNFTVGIESKDEIGQLSRSFDIMTGNFRNAQIKIKAYTKDLESSVKELQAEITRRVLTEKKLKKANRLYAALSQVNQTIVQESDQQKLFQKICDIFIEYGKFRLAWIGLANEENQSVIPVAFSGEGSDYVRNINISLTSETTGKGPTGRSILEGKSIIFNDLENNPDFSPWRKQAINKGYRSSAAFPIRLENKVIGTCNVYSVDPHFFDEDEIKLLEEAVLDISFALDKMKEEENRKQAEEELKQYTQQLETMSKTSLSLTAHLSLHVVLDVLLESVMQLMSVDDAHIFLYDGKELRFGAMRWQDERPQVPFAEPRQNGLTYRVARSGETIIVTDMSHSSIYQDWPLEGAIIGLPLLHNQQVVGVMNVASNIAQEFSESELRILHLLADQAAIAINNARLYEEVQQHARQLETLNTITAALSSTIELDKVLELILDQVGQVLPFDSGAVFLREEDGLRVVVDHGNTPSVKGHIFSVEENELFKEIQRTNIPLILNNVKDDPRFQNWGQFEKIESWMGVPLIVRDTLIGFLTLDSHQPDSYSSDYFDLVRPFASQAAQAIENARLFEEIIARNAELLSIYQSAQQLQHLYTPETLAQNIIGILEHTLDYELGAVLLIDKTTSQLTTFVLSDQEHGKVYEKTYNAYLSSHGIHLGQGITGWVAQNGESICCGDVRKDTRYFSVRDDIRSELCVPLQVRDQIIGVVNVESTRLNNFTESDQRVLETVASHIATAIQNAQLLEETRIRMKRLEALHTIDLTISGTTDINLTVGVFLDQLLIQLEVDAADVLLFDPVMLTLECIGRKGFRTSALRHTYLSQGLAGQVALMREIKHIPDLQEDEEILLASPDLSGEEFSAYYGIPLIAKGQLKGVLEIFHRSPLVTDDEWVGFLNTLAGQAAIAIDNNNLFNDLQHSNAKLLEAYDATIEGWVQALELRDWETEGHSRRVVKMTMQLAQILGIRGEKLVHIRRGALLHDIGKVGVPDAILQKPGKLTDEEWQIMRQHPVFAYEWLSPIEYLKPALDIPYYHHEKWDGSGYPHGLQGEQIPLSARIFAVIDVWDALRSDRPYRKAWPREKTLTYIREQSGKHFDPQMVDAFIEYIGDDSGVD